MGDRDIQIFVHMVDVREDEEWARGHLPGAIHLCKGIIGRDIEKVILHGWQSPYPMCKCPPEQVFTLSIVPTT